MCPANSTGGRQKQLDSLWATFGDGTRRCQGEQRSQSALTLEDQSHAELYSTVILRTSCDVGNGPGGEAGTVRDPGQDRCVKVALLGEDEVPVEQEKPPSAAWSYFCNRHRLVFDPCVDGSGEQQHGAEQRRAEPEL